MKVSEALEKGIELYPLQAFGQNMVKHEDGQIALCAMATIYTGATGKLPTHDVLTVEEETELYNVIGFNLFGERIPFPERFRGKYSYPEVGLYPYILKLNDDFQLSKPEILEEVERLGY